MVVGHEASSGYEVPWKTDEVLVVPAVAPATLTWIHLEVDTARSRAVSSSPFKVNTVSVSPEIEPVVVIVIEVEAEPWMSRAIWPVSVGTSSVKFTLPVAEM